ncbi:2-(1,2-epoxy-1,2-dihydrophenyl)acetyl-CoA isomerase [Rhodococcus sp. 27YEA15]|uniref:enoyl-CoA hydratase/isomerase family protein n=1 Tax=Rhodococcus sp. 27YEA15 TaxID=3156259 RepID=UPI003C7ECF55
MTDVIRLEIERGLATVTLGRPKSSNALDGAMKKQLLDALIRIREDSQVRAVLVLAEGRHFCVGQDLAEHAAALKADPAHAMDTVADHYNPIVTALAGISVPVVVGIGGACVGAGLGIALAADIRVAGRGASFATAFTGIGLASDSGLSFALVQALGASRASGLLLLGDRFDAPTASEWGLVHRVVSDEEVAEQATALARGLADGPTAAYREVKSLIKAQAPGLVEALAAESVSQVKLGASTDHQGAVAAFLSKQKPVFQGF